MKRKGFVTSMVTLCILIGLGVAGVDFLWGRHTLTGIDVMYRGFFDELLALLLCVLGELVSLGALIFFESWNNPRLWYPFLVRPLGFASAIFAMVGNLPDSFHFGLSCATLVTMLGLEILHLIKLIDLKTNSSDHVVTK